MGWDVAVYGELTFPAGKLAGWLNDTADASRYDDWQADFATTPGPDRPRVVRDGISDLLALRPTMGFVQVVVDDALHRVRIRAHLVEDAYHDLRREIATLWRTAGAHGAHGSLTFLGFMTIDFGYRFVIGPDGSRMEVLSEAARREADDSAEIAEIQTTIEELIGAQSPKPKAKAKPTKKRSKPPKKPRKPAKKPKPKKKKPKKPARKR